MLIACKINIIVEVLVNSGGHPWMMYLNVYTLVNNILKWKENGKIRKLFNVVDCMIMSNYDATIFNKSLALIGCTIY
jgi:hypothetical protein